jgi:ectoine hydroxylase-related dioxygenase (phytanoyl-CoA dioxygenase family)
MTTTLASESTLLERAEAGTLPPFGSWPKQGRPAGYFAIEQTEPAAAFYRRQGFAVLDQALGRAEIDRINQEASRLCRNRDGAIDGIAPGRADESEGDLLKRVLCLHFPNKVSELMAGIYHHPAIVHFLVRVIGPNVKAMQSMLFIKAAGKPGQAWHQDERFIPTRDRSLAGAWIALDDATVENGCLWVLPGSQQSGVIWPEHQHGSRKFDCTGEAWQFPYRDEESVPVEVKAGSIVFFNGYLLHRSLPNRAKTGFRRALVNHYMSAESLLPWFLPADHQGVGPADYRDIVLVAGEDPYAYKGTTNQSQACVRPSGEGGCGAAPNSKEAARKAEPGGVSPAGSISGAMGASTGEMGGSMGGGGKMGA